MSCELWVASYELGWPVPRLRTIFAEVRHDGGVIVKNIYRTEDERIMQKLFAVICSYLQLFAVSRKGEK